MARKLFCEISPLCYKISLKKEILLRNARDLFSDDRIALSRSREELPNIVKGHTSLLLRRLHGVDMTLQENKVTNIRLACEKINGIVIEPGETFSFWRTVGPATKQNGFLEGMTISSGKVGRGYGGGLCQMANMIHWLVLNSPLEVTELHHHSDALFPTRGGACRSARARPYSIIDLISGLRIPPISGCRYSSGSPTVSFAASFAASGRSRIGISSSRRTTITAGRAGITTAYLRYTASDMTEPMASCSRRS